MRAKELLRTGCLLAALVGPCFGAPAPALAQGTKATAQSLFDEGVKLMDQGNYRGAIDKLEESYRQESDTGTQYQLALCYEKTGRLASAWAAWKEVADRLDQAGERGKAEAARGLADKLLPRLSYVRVVVSEQKDQGGLVVKRDDAEIGRGAWGTSIPIDPGDHRVSASAPGKKTWETSFSVLAGTGGAAEPVDVRVPRLEDAAAASRGLGVQRTVAIVSGSLGLAFVGLGSGLGGGAVTWWQAATSSDHCQHDANGKLIANKCDSAGISMGKTADTLATASDVCFAVGGAGVAAAVVLWLTAPSLESKPPRTAWIWPVASPGHAGVVAGGSF